MLIRQRKSVRKSERDPSTSALRTALLLHVLASGAVVKYAPPLAGIERALQVERRTHTESFESGG
ncbi:MAG: hypothetical protein MJE77_03780 [Proteobacteria bacterium]|nr:hypothetical protein [Pseudomonadota bacterium]